MHNVLLALFLITVVASQRIVNPPIVRMTNSDGTDMSGKYDVSIRRYPQTTQRTTTTTSEPPLINGHFIDGITTLSTYDKNILDEDLVSKNCAFTFTLPNPVPTNQEVCVTDVRSMMMSPDDHGNDDEDEEARNLLRQEVLRWEESMESLRAKMEAKMETVGQGRVRSELSFLRNESRNMNERIVRLHMLLLNEIIRERDETIEISRMENDILNSSVKYLELKDQFDNLASEHRTLQQKTNAQEEVIEYLQRRMEEMTGQMNKVTLRAEEAAAWCKLAASSRNEEIPPPPENVTQPTPEPTIPPFRDCSAAQEAGFTTSGRYQLTIPNVKGKVEVWCDMDQDPGGWTVIQRRSTKKMNFYRNMGNYQRGFGSIDGDFWLGLERMHQLTTQSDINYKLHIDMEDWSGAQTFVEYESFKVGPEDDGYRLKIAHYSGTAGDSLSWHNNMRFSAKNLDQDLFERNCANYQRGGWWYNSCAHANLNGIYYVGGHYRSSYQNGMYWKAWRGASYSLKKVEMKIRPSE